MLELKFVFHPFEAQILKAKHKVDESEELLMALKGSSHDCFALSIAQNYKSVNGRIRYMKEHI